MVNCSWIPMRQHIWCYIPVHAHYAYIITEVLVSYLVSWYTTCLLVMILYIVWINVATCLVKNIYIYCYLFSLIGSFVGELKDTKWVLRRRCGVWSLLTNIFSSPLTFAYKKYNGVKYIFCPYQIKIKLLILVNLSSK